jgi:hypothetical protein
MNTKLTLRLDDELIRSAKRYSHETGKSLSQMVGDYFALIAARNAQESPGMSPRVRSLAGALKGATVDEDDYRRHLEEKHR